MSTKNGASGPLGQIVARHVEEASKLQPVNAPALSLEFRTAPENLGRKSPAIKTSVQVEKILEIMTQNVIKIVIGQSMYDKLFELFI